MMLILQSYDGFSKETGRFAISNVFEKINSGEPDTLIARNHYVSVHLAISSIKGEN